MTEMDRRDFLKTAAAATGAAAAATVPGAVGEQADAAGSGFLPYTPDSYYKSSAIGLPVNTARTVSFHNFMATHPDQKATKHPVIQGLSSKWGTVYAEGTATDPVWTLTGTINTRAARLKTTGFCAPAWLGTQLTGTTDSPFCVLDLANGYTVFGTKAVMVSPPSGTKPGVIKVSSAGITYHDSNGLDYRAKLSGKTVGDKRNFTSRGRISDAMVIRRDRVDAAIAAGTGLGHVLHMFLVETKSTDGFRYPMVGAESNKNGFGAEGERIAIDPAVDLTTRNLSPFGIAVARTLQENGCYFGDNAGRMSTLKAEQASPTHDPWFGLDTDDNSLAGGITWADFVVIA